MTKNPSKQKHDVKRKEKTFTISPKFFKKFNASASHVKRQ